MVFWRTSFACLFLVNLAVCQAYRKGSTRLSDGDAKFPRGDGNDTEHGKPHEGLSKHSPPQDVEPSVEFVPDVLVVPRRRTSVGKPKPFHPDDLFRTIAEGNSSQSRHHGTGFDSGLNSHHRQPASSAGATATTLRNSTQKTAFSTKQSTGRPVITTTGQPDVTTTGQPDIATTGRPDVTTTGQPDVTTTGQPDVTTTGRPDVTTAGQPDVTTTGQPDVTTTGQPDVTTTGQPGVTTTGRPDVTIIGQPDVTTTGQPGVTTTGRPRVTTTGQPDVTTIGQPNVNTTGRPGVTTTGQPDVTTTQRPFVTTIRQPDVTTTATATPVTSLDDGTGHKATTRPVLVTDLRLDEPEHSTDSSSVPRSTIRSVPELSSDEGTEPNSTYEPTQLREVLTDDSTVPTTSNQTQSITDKSDDTAHGKGHVSQDSMSQDTGSSSQFIPDVWVLPKRRTFFETLKPFFSANDSPLTRRPTTPASSAGTTGTTLRKLTQRTVLSTKQITGQQPGVSTNLTKTLLSVPGTVHKSTTGPTSVTDTRLGELLALAFAGVRDLTDSGTDGSGDTGIESTADDIMTFPDVTDQSGSSDTPISGPVITDTNKKKQEMAPATESLSDNTSEVVIKLPVPMKDLDGGDWSSDPPTRNLPTALPGTSSISTNKSDTVLGKGRTPTTQTITERTRGSTIDMLLPAPMAMATVGESATWPSQLHVLKQTMAVLVPRIRAFVRHLSFSQKVKFLDEFIQKYKAQILSP